MARPAPAGAPPPPPAEEEQYTKRGTQYFAALGATLGGMCLGTVIGWQSPAGTLLKKAKAATDDQLSWVGSVMPLGAVLALFVLAFVFDLVGRKWIMISVAPPFIAGWLILAFTTNFYLLLVGRMICGFCGATFCVAAPTFTGEIAEKAIRGRLGVCFQLFITIGILLSYCLGEANNLKILTVPNCIFPIAASLILLFMYESPVYRLKKGNEDKARKALQFYRGKDYEVDQEMKEMLEYTKVGSETFWQSFKKKGTIKAFIMLLGMHIIQQLSGINAVMFFAHQIFEMSGSNLRPGISAMIIGVVQVLCTFLSAALVDKIGRKLLWLISLGLMGISQFFLGIFFMIQTNDKKTADKIGWLPLCSLCLYIVGFSLGAGPLPWAMLGELMPNRVKGVISSVVGCINWLLAFVVTVSFQTLLNILKPYTVFWGFALICGLGFAFILIFVIETKGKTLDQIQKELGGGRQ